MRDRNQLTQNLFNIQLMKKVCSSTLFTKILEQEKYFSHKTCLRRSDPTNRFVNSEFRLKLPGSFRLTRALAISVWYFPEDLRFLYLVELENQNFQRFNPKQQIELKLLLSSKETMEKFLFLTQRYSGPEIFGNILGNDLLELAKLLRIQLVFPNRARQKIYRRGPKDKGSRRSDSSVRIIAEEIRNDFYINEHEKIRNKRIELTLQTYHRILQFIENYRE